MIRSVPVDEDQCRMQRQMPDALAVQPASVAHRPWQDGQTVATNAFPTQAAKTSASGWPVGSGRPTDIAHLAA